MTLNMTVVQLPRDYDDPLTSHLLKSFVAKSKEIRLESLRSDPTAFSSNLARETAFDDSVWESRLKNSIGRTFIALDLTNERNVKKVLSESEELNLISRATWIGTTVLVGPRIYPGVVPAEPISGEQIFHEAKDLSATNSRTWKVAIDDGNPSATHPGSLVYVMNAVYVLSSCRGRGVGKDLILSAMKKAKEDVIEGHDGNPFNGDRICFAHVKTDNVPAKTLYESLGFRTVRVKQYGHNGQTGTVAVMRYDVEN